MVVDGVQGVQGRLGVVWLEFSAQKGVFLCTEARR
jgi:hypothetical protein